METITSGEKIARSGSNSYTLHSFNEMILNMPYEQNKVTENQGFVPLSHLWASFTDGDNQMSYSNQNMQLQYSQNSKLVQYNHNTNQLLQLCQESSQCSLPSNQNSGQLLNSNPNTSKIPYSNQNSNQLLHLNQEPSTSKLKTSSSNAVTQFVDKKYEKSVQNCKESTASSNHISEVDHPNMNNIFWQINKKMLHFSSPEACKFAQNLLNLSKQFTLSENLSAPMMKTISTQTEILNQSLLSIEEGESEDKTVKVAVLFPKRAKLSNGDSPTALNMTTKNQQSSVSRNKKSTVAINLDHLTPLFNPDKLSLEEIKAFNNYWSAYVPHCSICSALSMRAIKGNKAMPSDWQFFQPLNLPETSPIWISSMLFAVSNVSKHILVENNKLLRCIGCQVTVHASCYGIQNFPQNLKTWMCNKCEYNVPKMKCCLCPMNVGAIKRVNNNQWIHALCAFLSSNTRFEMECPSPGNTDPSDMFNVYVIPSIIDSPMCCYCHQNVGNCVTCQRCDIQFHVLCGLVYGAMYANSKTEYYKLEIICHRHMIKENIPVPIRLAEEVYARVKLQYFKAYVVSIEDIMCYRIRPQYSSQQEVIPVSDILNYSSGYHPTIGSEFPLTYWKQRVRFYQKYDCNATFLGIAHIIKYIVKFEDGSVIELDRKNIFSLDQKLRKIPSLQTKVSPEPVLEVLDSPPTER